MMDDSTHDDFKKRHKVVILGAGIAGLSAGKHLVKNNLTDFIILEAKNRIGGRILSAQVGISKVELGANWIHGVLGNPMYEIAMTHGLISVVNSLKPHRVVAATEDGKQVPFSILQEIYGAYMCFLHRCEEYFLCQYLPPEGIYSVGEHINLEIALYLDRIPNPNERRIRQLIFQCLLKRETCISGCDSMNEIDLLELGSYTELQGGNIVLPTGYSSILGPVSQDIPKKNIFLNHEVSTVRWFKEKNDDAGSISESGNESDDSGKTVINANDRLSNLHIDERLSDSGRVEIVCSNGFKITADHLICTLPLGVLKENATKMFRPQLPNYKIDSIDKLLFGTVDKIFLGYDRPFLNQDISEVLLLWETDLDNPDISKNDISETWYRKIYSFSKVSETLLLAWISGKEAKYMESLPDQIIADTCTDILRKFLNDPYVPKPKFTFCSRWHSDKTTRGSYTAIAVGSSQADIESVAQPLYSEKDPNKPVILFGGEHTHNNFYSTVHGAYLSGRTAAQLVLDSNYNNNNNKIQKVLHCNETNDLSSWIQGISLE